MFSPFFPYFSPFAIEKLAPNVRPQVVNLDFRQGLPVPLNVVTLRDSSGAFKGSRSADGTAATVRVKVHGCWLRGYILATRTRGTTGDVQWGFYGGLNDISHCQDTLA